MPTVVVLEDDDLIRRLIVKVLSEEGFDVADFPDPALALDSVDFAAVDLIITDLAMPTSGEEFIRMLKRQDIQTPIIVMSGYLPDRKLHFLNALGVQAFIRKPFLLSEFLDQVRSWT